MRLTEPLEGSAFGLRSPVDGDARFTVELRSDPAVAQYLHRIRDGLDAQRDWERQALARDDDLPLIIFRCATGAPVGTAGIYNIDHERGSAEWGRWAISPGSPAAVESVLLILRAAFDVLDLRTLYSRTMSTNVRVVSFHDSAGFVREGEGTMDVDGSAVSYVAHVVRTEGRHAVSCRLEPLAKRVALHLS